ncbi:BON domain-containing protein [Legionella cardiaca]|uniref:BON domain-containing protein n=1 Tax=Legionella cardiaca TaxID=1071983 RepID=A0ABY8ARC0_9GAMM|nr:BON domain-containing protein [Legionella cardiaca]WED43078.1 BON domain-containing protein [Legionella cardiaca]
MDRLFRLKAATILLSSSLAFGAFANVNSITATPSTDPAQAIDPDSIQVSDQSLLSSVRTALSAYKNKVYISVDNGIIYLAGQLDSDTDYERVINLTQATPGVGEVNVDKLAVKDSQQPLKDSFLTAKIKAALMQADLMGKDLPSWSISVETKDGQVFLSGQVASNKEKQAIMEVVKSVKGVNKISDKIDVSANPAEANS